MVTDVNVVTEKAELPIVTSELPRIKDSSGLKLNAYCPILVTESGMATEVSLLL